MAIDLAPDPGLVSLGVGEAVRLAHGSLYPAGVFPPGAVLPMAHGDKGSWHYRPKWDDVEGQVQYAVAHQDAPVYRVGVAMSPDLAPGKSGRAEDVVGACALWADIDDSRGVHHPQALPDPSNEQAWEVLSRYPLPPTGVVDTGGGLLVWWATTVYDPKSGGGKKLLEAHCDALEAIHKEMGVAFDPAVPRTTRPVTRVPAGINGKHRPEPGPQWPAERVELVRPDIETAPVRLVLLSPGRRYKWEDLGGVLEDAGLLVPRPVAVAHPAHVCGGPSPEERICTTLPMSRICREMSFLDPGTGRLIEWADRQDIPDGQEHPLTWAHENGRTVYARLYFGPPAGEPDMAPVSTLTCWGTGTAAVFGAEPNRGATCTWRWLRWGYFREQTAARNFAQRFADSPDEAMEVLTTYPRAVDLLRAEPSLRSPIIVVGGKTARDRALAPSVTDTSGERASARRRGAGAPWAAARKYDAGDLIRWLDAHPAGRYGVAVTGSSVDIATADESIVVRCSKETMQVLADVTASGERGHWYAHDASDVARSVALRSGCRLDLWSTRAGSRALYPGEPCDLDGGGAMVVARLAEELASHERARDAARAAKADRLWRHLATDGITVDIDALRAEVGRKDSTTLNKATELLRAADANGRVHPIIEVYSTVTGRMTAHDPGVQNIPAQLRRCFMADEGKLLVGLDLHQVEPRLAAAMSRDETMSSGDDVYVTAAEVIWPGEAVTPERRKVAKSVLLARLYGEGAPSLATRLGVPQDEAKRITGALLSGWPKLRGWLASLEAAAAAGRPLTTLAKRVLPAPDSPHKATNYVVQGSGADLFYMFVNRVARQLPHGASLWLPVHDELIVQCEADDADVTSKLLAEQMRATVSGVLVSGEPVVYGSRWGC